MTDAPGSTAPLPADPGPRPAPRVDLSKAQIMYINFCRVTGTAEELVIDFAHEMAPTTESDPPLLALQRIALGHLTGKRLLEVLRLTIQDHERSFGTVETTIESRLVELPG